MLRWTKSSLQNKRGTAVVSPAPPPAAAAPPAQPVPTPPVRPPQVEATPKPEAAASPARPKGLAQVLLEQGKISQDQLDRALIKQKETGAFLGEILVAENMIDENSFLSFLAKHCKIPHLSLLDYLIDPKILSLVPKEICLKFRLLPIDKMGRNLTVAMVNPINPEALQAVRECCPGLQVKPILCAYNHFEAVTRKFFEETETGPAVAEVSLSSLGLAPSAQTVPAAPAITVAPPPELPAAPPSPAESPFDFDAVTLAVPEPAPAAAPARQKADSDSLFGWPEETVAAAAVEEDIPEVLEALPEAEEEMDEDTVVDTVFGGMEAGLSTPGDTEAGDVDEASAMMHEMTSVMMESMRDTYAVLARRIDLFQGVSPDDVAKLFARGITVEFPAGTTIFEKGQTGTELFVILGGEVAIHDGVRQLAVLSRGDMFGEMALVSNEPRSAFAHASADTSLLSLSWDIINRVMPPEVSIRLLTNILVTMSERLRIANEALREATAHPRQ